MIARRLPAGDSPRTRPRTRRGISLIETQIAFVVLGIGLAGLCPIVAMNYRQLSNLEGNIHAPDAEHSVHYLSPTTANGQRGRLQAFSCIYHGAGTRRTEIAPGQAHYLVPWNNPWARKLTARAQLVPGPWSGAGSLDPTVSSPSTPSVSLLSLERTDDGSGHYTGWRASVETK